MALSNTLYAGLSGLDVNQSKLNVVGNNIANANTVAFKSSRVLFKPQFYVTDSAGSQPEGDFGGANPSQRGLGAVVAGLDKDFTPGSIETTGRPTDLAIDGDGFFVVRSAEQKYTRDGSFRLNAENKLVTSAGDLLQGYGINKDFDIVAGQLSDITIPLGTLTTAQATTRAVLSGNLNADGQRAAGASLLATQAFTLLGGAGTPDDNTLLTDIASPDNVSQPLFAVNDVYQFAGRKGGRSVGDADFTVQAASTLTDLMTFFRERLGINTSVPDDGDPATALPGVTLEADPAAPGEARIVIAGNTGDENAITMPSGSFSTIGGTSPFTFTPATNADGVSSDPSGESVRASFVVYDSLGTPVTVNIVTVLESSTPTGNLWRFYAESPSNLPASGADIVIGSGTLLFDTFGKLQGATGTTIQIGRTDTGAVSPLNVELDLTQLTGLTSRSSDLALTSQDGSPIGRLSAFSVGADGKVIGNFTNGVNRTLGQLALASFTNPQGLVDRGGNMYIEGPNSGTAIVGIPQSFGTGKIVAGALELSNVDLSEEFINLIIASTGFSAASRVISTSDQLLTELLNTSR